MTAAAADRSTAWDTAPTLHVAAAGTRFAYRRLGPAEGVPVVLLNHWGANLDNFDPPIVEGLAADRPVYAIDYRGVGRSGGTSPVTMQPFAEDLVAAIDALGLRQVDLIGFSFGGFVAQQVVIDAPDRVRRLVLAGTGPAGGAGIAQIWAVTWPRILRGLATFRDPKFYLFFTATKAGRGAAKAFLTRIGRRTADRDKAVTPAAFWRQLRAIRAWGEAAP